MTLSTSHQQTTSKRADHLATRSACVRPSLRCAKCSQLTPYVCSSQAGWQLRLFYGQRVSDAEAAHEVVTSTPGCSV